MKDKFVIQRYATYLNKCMFMAQDDFIKKKYKAYIDKIHPTKSENFFERMQKDQEKRIQKEKEMQESKMNSSFDSGRHTDIQNQLASKVRLGSKFANDSNDISSFTINQHGDDVFTPKDVTSSKNQLQFQKIKFKQISLHRPASKKHLEKMEIFVIDDEEARSADSPTTTAP